MILSSLPPIDTDCSECVHDPSNREIRYYHGLYLDNVRATNNDIQELARLDKSFNVDEPTIEEFAVMWRRISRNGEQLAWWLARLSPGGYERDYRQIRAALDGIRVY